MGFCEMIYDETRNFPEAEQQGLAKELRWTAMKLLSSITRESVKNQKAFLKTLDNTIETQLDALLLLKLAFRMGYIEQRVYQTLEEDLKGLEKIINEMKEMHGISVSTESIFGDAEEPTEPEQKSKPEPVSAKSQEKSKPTSSRKSHSKKHQRSRTGKYSKSDQTADQTQEKSSGSNKKESKKEKSPEQSDLEDTFKGTPLYEDDEDMKSEKTDQSISEMNSSDETSDNNGQNSTSVSQDNQPSKKRKNKGRWTLKRSSTRKSTQKSD